MLSLSFSRSNFETCLYFKKPKENTSLFALLYVDDILLISNLSQWFQM